VNQLEEVAWKKDETPYLVFSCAKCNGFTYVKTSQKRNKCPRCGRLHLVSNILGKGEIINGISAAVNHVKEKQNELAIKELGAPPEFRSFNDFKVGTIVKSSKDEIGQEEEVYIYRFKKMLIKLAEMYKEFPFYVIEFMADNYGIPSSEVKILTRLFQKEGILIRKANSYYIVNID